MSELLRNRILEYRHLLEQTCGSHLMQVILYGSYARGTNRPDSDIDIMILLDLDQDKLAPIENKIYDLTYDFNCSYQTDIMPVVQSKKHFDYWKNTYPFYHNVAAEGVTL